MLEEREDITKSNYFLRKRKKARHNNETRGMRNRLFIVGIVFSLLLISTLYVVSPISKVYRIAIDGNIYLDDDHYRDLASVTDDDIYYLTFDGTIEDRILNETLVKEVDVHHDDHNIITITVTEKKIIGYIYEDKPYLVTDDGSLIEMREEHYGLISMVPLIIGYTEDELIDLARGFKNIDDEIIAEISEVHSYPFSYDERMMEFIMRSGNYVYVSYYGLALLNNYHSIESSLSTEEDHVCIFLDEVTNSGYTSACPFWDDGSDEVQTDAQEESADEITDEMIDEVE